MVWAGRTSATSASCLAVGRGVARCAHCHIHRPICISGAEQAFASAARPLSNRGAAAANSKAAASAAAAANPTSLQAYRQRTRVAHERDLGAVAQRLGRQVGAEGVQVSLVAPAAKG